MRQNFNSGQEIIYQDLNTVSSRLERQLYDRIFSKILQGKTDSFFDDDFKVIYIGATSAQVSSGFGFQNVSGGEDSEPVNQPLYLSANESIVFDTPDSSNPRIDIICVKATRANSIQESRKFKDEFTDTISTIDFTTVTDWEAEVLVVAGTPAGSPTAPSTPTGYLKIAEVSIPASVGMADQNDITDLRTLLPKASSVSGTGFLGYDKVVGPSATIGTTHATLKEAVDAASSGDRILVTEDQDIDATVVVSVANLEIVFKKGATMTKDGAANCLQLSADDCTIRHARFSGFSTASDIGLLIDSGVKRSYIEAARFLNCDTNIDDSGTETYIPIAFVE